MFAVIICCKEEEEQQQKIGFQWPKSQQKLNEATKFQSKHHDCWLEVCTSSFFFFVHFQAIKLKYYYCFIAAVIFCFPISDLIAEEKKKKKNTFSQSET